MGPALANLGYLGAGAPARWRLERAFRRPEHEQLEILWRTVRASSKTSFGREHSLGSVRSLSEWRARVPLRDYDAYRPYVKRIEEVEPNMLTEPPVLFIRTTDRSAGIPHF